MTLRATTLVGALVVLLLVAVPAARADLDHAKRPPTAHPADVAAAWFDMLYQVVKAERTGPPPASRVYGLAGVALYESLVSGSPGHRSLVGQLNELTSLPAPKRGPKHHWPSVAGSALARVIRGLYPTASPASLAAVDGLEAAFDAESRARVARPVHERSVALGRAVAEGVLAWAATDGLTTHASCPYAPSGMSGSWEPTPPAFAPNPAQPCWGQLRPMVLASGAECGPPGPPAFSTDPGSDFHASALDVYGAGAASRTSRRSSPTTGRTGPGRPARRPATGSRS
ncbi:MAG: hypothetical protein ACREMB_14365 [Candidatus Rokuibacteriota bacterium]